LIQEEWKPVCTVQLAHFGVLLGSLGDVPSLPGYGVYSCGIEDRSATVLVML